MTTSNNMHTAGPWIASLDHSGSHWRVEPDSAEYLNDGWVIAVEFHGPQAEANALLAAAAPELLEALVELDRVYETGDFETEFRPALDRARAAIAKATGEAA